MPTAHDIAQAIAAVITLLSERYPQGKPITGQQFQALLKESGASEEAASAVTHAILTTGLAEEEVARGRTTLKWWFRRRSRQQQVQHLSRLAILALDPDYPHNVFSPGGYARRAWCEQMQHVLRRELPEVMAGVNARHPEEPRWLN